MSKKSNYLIVIENGKLTSYLLDDRLSWEIGRPSGERVPDIRLHTTTVSRKHGKLQNMDGIWFYVDYYGKNGTVYNEKKLTAGMNGRSKPVLLSNGDVLIFGGGDKAVIGANTVWALFLSTGIDDEWSVVDTRGYREISFTSGEKTIHLEKPQKGEVIEEKEGIAIYMGDLTYTLGEMKVEGRGLEV